MKIFKVLKISSDYQVAYVKGETKKEVMENCRTRQYEDLFDNANSRIEEDYCIVEVHMENDNGIQESSSNSIKERGECSA